MSAELANLYAPAPRTERGKPCLIGVGEIKKVKKIVYCVGKAVVVRDLANPLDAWMFHDHKADTTVARIAPSGFYIASADQSATIKVWDCVGEKTVKLEKQTIGNILDMAWSDDSKRLVVGGQGRDKQGEAFFSDGGASVGEISGHSAPITSVDVKQTRPYRVATGSEDFKNNWFEGPPFKYKKTNLDHSRYVNCVRFAPNGEKYITVGSDKKGFLYDGKAGDKIGELSAKGAHGGSVYCAAWTADSSKILTASVDKTCKLWNAEGELITTFEFGKDVNDQQLGCAILGDEMLAINLTGTINYLDLDAPNKPKKTILGHNKLITAIAYDPSGDKLYSADFGGYLIEWNPSNGSTNGFTGAAHQNQVQKLKVANGKLITASFDDTVKIIPLDSRQLSEGIALGSQPSGLDASGDVVVVSAVGNIVVIENGKLVNKHPVTYAPSAIAINPDRTEVAVGAKDNKIYLYSYNAGKLTQTSVLEGHRGEITALQYSPDGQYLGAGDGNREVKVWKNGAAVVDGWVFHTSRIQDLAWSSDSIHLATGSVDSAVIVWNVQEPTKRVTVKLAHVGGVRAVTWLNANTVASAGQDCAVKTWKITY